MEIWKKMGVPAYVERLYKEEPRPRHPIRCVFCQERSRVCANPSGAFAGTRCRSTVNCACYKEKEL